MFIDDRKPFGLRGLHRNIHEQTGPTLLQCSELFASAQPQTFACSLAPLLRPVTSLYLVAPTFSLCFCPCAVFRLAALNSLRARLDSVTFFFVKFSVPRGERRFRQRRQSFRFSLRTGFNSVLLCCSVHWSRPAMFLVVLMLLLSGETNPIQIRRFGNYFWNWNSPGGVRRRFIFGFGFFTRVGVTYNRGGGWKGDRVR